VIAWVLHILELIAGIFGVSVGFALLPDAASALGVVTPTAVGLGRAFGLRQALRLPRVRRQAPRVGVDEARVPVRGRFRQPRLRAGGVPGVLRRVGVGAQIAAVLGYGLYLLQAALLHTWQSVRGEGGLRRLFQSALPALIFSLLMIYLAISGMIATGRPLF
jgi:hypothetical protein